MVQYDWMRVFFVALMGASLTMALRTGSLWPVFPNVRRTEAPRKFWLGVAFYGFFVVGFFVGVVLVLLSRFK
jgi:hypothetical protein